MYTNEQNIPLAVALFLATDNYDHASDPNEISVTTLIKPVRQIVLGSRAGDAGDGMGDISSLIASRIGTAIHEGIENAWLSPMEALKKLGLPKGVRNAIIVNPSAEDDLTDRVPIYLEKRTKKEIGGRIVSGCFDFCGDGSLGDFKTTGTFQYTKKKSDQKYILQGSIYRWLNPEIVTEDIMHIYFIFKDWSAKRALGSSDYPQSSVHDYKLTMLSYEETERYIKNKISEVTKYMNAHEDDLPQCPDSELWMDESEYKYYAKPEAKRATKNFGSDASAAYAHRALKGVGMVKEVKAEPKACLYCPAINCSQRDGYIASGVLKI